ncbi:aminodeoxychorismate synthase component I [Devosia oryzisoli]|uniref:aminodeoxychorismate synthase component I n=1 Tax=Devosia oryzisoli TaxID=2774138 RepID=UPI0020C05F25|nr:aminodeoxychorismate synthase component I [Devosia oryzisoli]
MIAPGTVLLHDNRSPGAQSLLFEKPHDIIVAHDAASARQGLARLATAQKDGLWAAGYLAYELGYLFEERLAGLFPERSARPLLWLGLYDAPRHLGVPEVEQWLGAEAGAVRDLVPTLDEDGYAAAFERVQDLIAAGDTYQVNLTFKARFRLDGEPSGLYRTLAASQPAAHGAFIHAGDHWVLSRSPELFLERIGERLSARPMKGTTRRSPSPADDRLTRERLRTDPKNRAENLMIVDLLRNDLGRVARTGSVEVTDLFTVETFPTLHTLTSGIVAQAVPGLGFAQAMQHLFPCGSITGAPKLRAMQIIHDIERKPRGVYTGSIGFLAPNGDFRFNVAIRTAVIETGGAGEIGIGGGIVADSRCEDEYAEALLKMQFLSRPMPPVTLIETLKWDPESGYVLLERHLDRLVASADYFDLPVDRAGVAKLLADAASDWTEPMRVRLTLAAAGPAVTAVPLPPNPDIFRFVLAAERLDSQSLWLAHKTTNRAFYDEPRQRAHAALGVDEVVFRNERDELTEGSITSVFLEREGRLLTPPPASGLLPGTLRAQLLDEGKAEERVLTLADLSQAEAIWLGNSVRGLIRAEWIRTDHD